MKIETDGERLMWHDALIAAGVDNWDGFDEARAIYKEWLQESQEVENNNQPL